MSPHPALFQAPPWAPVLILPSDQKTGAQEGLAAPSQTKLDWLLQLFDYPYCANFMNAVLKKNPTPLFSCRQYVSTEWLLITRLLLQLTRFHIRLSHSQHIHQYTVQLLYSVQQLLRYILQQLLRYIVQQLLWYIVQQLLWYITYTADALSRAPVDTEGEETMEFPAEVAFVDSVIQSLLATSQRLEVYRRAQAEDSVCSKVIEYRQSSWPEKRALDISITPSGRFHHSTGWPTSLQPMHHCPTFPATRNTQSKS